MSVSLKIAVFGSSSISVPVFEALRKQFEIALAVISDEPHMRRGKTIINPVQTWAEAAGIPVLNGTMVPADQLAAVLHAKAVDLLFLLSYGKLLSEDLLDIPRLGSLNLHPSPLPFYRGAAPIERQIMEGATTSAVSIIRMSGKLDRGELLAQEPFAIAPSDYRPEVEASIIQVGIPLVLRVIDDLVHARSHAIPQAEAGSYAHKLTQADELIDWTRPAQNILNRIRALFPDPCAATFCGAERVKILRAQLFPSDIATSSLPLPDAAAGGTIALFSHHRAVVQCGDGWLELLQLQFPGKKAMSVTDLLNGRRLVPGMVFSSPHES